MKKSIKVNLNKRGRPATGRDPVSAVRFPVETTTQIDAWAAKQVDHPSRSEAIRRLVEVGLKVKQPQRQASEKQRARAKEIAGSALDKLVHGVGSPEDRANRKRRLMKGPEEFREARIDRPKSGRTK